jgi:Cd2+/Zn2+-exporting ATPase
VDIGAADLLPANVVDLWVSVQSPVGAIRTYFIAEDGSAALFVLRDEARPEAGRAIEELRKLGIGPIVMLTGDAEQTAQEIGRLTKVDSVRSSLLPEEKVQIMQELVAAHQHVGMVGDGVNDAPVLAAASVGIAMGVAGSPAAIEAADVSLMGDDLLRLPYSIRLARRAGRVVRTNIAVAIGLKVILAVGAIAGVVSLATAVLIGDMGASVLVTLNALRVARTS